MSSTNSYYTLLFSGSNLSKEEIATLLLEGRRHFLNSEHYFSLSHSELLWYLRNDAMDVADEHELFQAIIRWAITKYSNSDDGIAAGRGRRPSIKVLKSFISPPGKDDLMKEIRVGLFSKNQWDDVTDSKEACLLPLTLWENKVLKEYLAAPADVKERMINEGDLESFNLHPRAMSTENGTDENQTRSGGRFLREEADSDNEDEDQGDEETEQSLLNQVAELSSLNAKVTTLAVKEVAKLVIAGKIESTDFHAFVHHKTGELLASLKPGIFVSTKDYVQYNKLLNLAKLKNFCVPCDKQMNSSTRFYSHAVTYHTLMGGNFSCLEENCGVRKGTRLEMRRHYEKVHAETVLPHKFLFHLLDDDDEQAEKTASASHCSRKPKVVPRRQTRGKQGENAAIKKRLDRQETALMDQGLEGVEEDEDSSYS